MSGSSSVGDGLPTFIFSAPRGGVGEKVLREISKRSFDGPGFCARHFSTEGCFGEWQGDVCEGIVSRDKMKARVVLKLGVREGVCLLEISSGKGVGTFSLKPIRHSLPGVVEIPIGVKIPEIRIAHVASSVLVAYVFRSKGWTDNRGVVHTAPYGTEPKPRVKRSRSDDQGRLLRRSRPNHGLWGSYA